MAREGRRKCNRRDSVNLIESVIRTKVNQFNITILCEENIVSFDLEKRRRRRRQGRERELCV